MLKIGLTGGIGSGKSTVADLFSKQGVPIVDTDAISREITEPGTECFEKIVQHFGPHFVQKNGQLNRRLIRELIFADKAKRHWLESLLHPKIIALMTEEIMQLKAPFCIAVVPLLIEAKLGKLFDRILVVHADEEVQVARTKARDHTEDADIKQIIQTQCTTDDRLKIADDVITNNGSLEKLSQRVKDLHQVYTQLV